MNLFLNVLFLSLLLPLITFAQDFVPLVGIPYVDTDSGDRSLGDYVNALYIAAISIAAVLAVLRIIYAGVQYMLSDIVTQKGEAKKTIRNALIGLILIVAAFLILNTINPQLTSLNSLDQLQGLNVGLTQRDSREVTVNINGDFNTCSDTGSVEAFEANCPGSIRRTIDDSNCEILTCAVTTNTDIEEEEIEAEEEEDIESGEYQEVIETFQRPEEYGLTLTPEELVEFEQLIEDFANRCEVDSNGNDTGYVFLEIDDGNVGISEMRRICVRP